MESGHPVAPYARTEQLLVRELSDEVLIYDLERHRAHSLNHSAALVWRHCDGKTTVAELAVLLRRELGLPADDQVVWMALARLQRAGLLQDRLTVPGVGANYSRRALLRKLALAGGLTALLPLVESIVAPEAAQAQSCPPGNSCRGLPDCTPCLAGGSGTCGKLCCGGNCEGTDGAMNICGCVG